MPRIFGKRAQCRVFLQPFTSRLSFLLWLSSIFLVISGCNSGSDTAATLPASADVVVTNLSISDIASNTANLAFTTTPATAATIKIWIDSDNSNKPAVKTLTSTAAINHLVPITGLWSATPWRVEVTSGEASSNISFESGDPQWLTSSCRTGTLTLPVDAQGNWSIFTDVNGSVISSATSGCEDKGDGVRLEFDLGDGEWVVAQGEDFATPVDLSAYTHLWIPFRGTPDVPVAMEIKLRDKTGGLSMVRLDGGVSVPVWRSWAVDLREFKSQQGELNLSAVSGIEIAFSWPLNLGGTRRGVVELADLQAWNLSEEVPEVAGFERIPRDEMAMSEIASDLLARQEDHGFIAAWYDLAPNLHLYANAMALIVFTLEYERLSDADDPAAATYENAARRMADAFAQLQTLSDRGGAWDDSFIEHAGSLTRRSAGSRIVWVGSTAWAGLAMILARDTLPDGSVYNDSISSAASYYTNLQTCRNNAGLPTGSITEGTEGNISSHLFLASAASRGLADTASATGLGDFIGENLFDPSQQRFFCGVAVDFGTGFNQQACTLGGTGAIQGGDGRSCLDVVANWGTEWLLRQGRSEDALKGLAYGRYVFPTRAFNNTAINGLGDIAGPWTPTVEFGAGQWAVAGGPDSNYLMQQAKMHLCSAGACQGAADNLSTGIGWNTTARGISPSAWMYLAWHGEFWSRL